MSAVAVLRMTRSDTFMTDEPENISVADLSRRKKCLDIDDSKTIHSGNFMVTRVHGEEDEEDDETEVETALSPADVKKEGFDFDSAIQETSQEYHFGHNISIDGSLTKLFQCMTLAYSGKLTSPKFKLFKGLKLMLKDKLRLNNIIWREWHMQFIKSRRPVVCQFSAPLDAEGNHSRAEAVVMEGKYWKRRLDTVTLEYKKWRVYFKEKFKKMRARNQGGCDLTNQQLIDQMPMTFKSQDPVSFDDDFMMDFSDTLFSSLNQPFAFPNPREINYMANPDFIQPGLIQLQPNLDDFMDTLDPLQEMINTSRTNSVVTFTGQNSPSAMLDMYSPSSVLQDSLAGGDLLGNTVDLAESLPVDQNLLSEAWSKANNFTSAVPIAFTTYQPVTVAPTTYSVVAVTQPLAPVAIQPAPTTNKDSFAVPFGKPARTRQRPIAPAPPTPSVVPSSTLTLPVSVPVQKNLASQNNSCLAQLLTAVGSYPGLKLDQQSTTVQQTSPIASTSKLTPKKSATNSGGRLMTLAKMLAADSSPTPDMSTADTVASILAGVVESPSEATAHKLLSPASVPSYSSKPINIPQSSRRKSDPPISSEQFDNADSILDQASSPTFDLADSPKSSDGYRGARPKSENYQYKEQRRALHITAEQKRRVNIKSGFDMLHTLIPALQQNLTSKISKAQMLQKTAEYCRKLKSERSSMQEEADVLRQEIETLKDAISNCQAQLPATGVPVTRQRTDQQQELFEDYVKNRTLQDWRFWIFSRIIRSLFVSYNNIVSTASMEDLCRSVLAWLDQHCSLVQLRTASAEPVSSPAAVLSSGSEYRPSSTPSEEDSSTSNEQLEVFNSLRQLSTTTSILSNPTRVRDEAIAAVTKQERRDSI